MLASKLAALEIPAGDDILLEAVTDSRAHARADAIGSVRAEGLEPGATVVEILDRWADDVLDTEQLGEAAERLAAGQSVAHLLGRPDRVATQR
jgi:hypothetical protein